MGGPIFGEFSEFKRSILTLAKRWLYINEFYGNLWKAPKMVLSNVSEKFDMELIFI